MTPPIPESVLVIVDMMVEPSLTVLETLVMVVMAVGEPLAAERC